MCVSKNRLVGSCYKKQMSIPVSQVRTSALMLLCDEMLIRLCRWIRAAGYDCAMLPPGSPDRDIMSLAKREDRLVITRDRQFLNYRQAKDWIVFIHTQDLDAQALELSQALSIDWLFQPFSRCLVCNSPLVLADREQRRQLKVQLRADEDLWTCPGCHRHYWAGSHVRRMYRRLAGWNQLAALRDKNEE